MLAMNFGESGARVAVHARIKKQIEVGGAANSFRAAGRGYVVERHNGELFDDLLRGQRGGKAQLRNVDAAVGLLPLLSLVVAGKGVAQIQDGRGIEGQVVGHQDVAPVGQVLGIVGVPPWRWEDVGLCEE